jgi:hypothetical protein
MTVNVKFYIDTRHIEMTSEHKGNHNIQKDKNLNAMWHPPIAQGHRQGSLSWAVQTSDSPGSNFNHPPVALRNSQAAQPKKLGSSRPQKTQWPPKTLRKQLSRLPWEAISPSPWPLESRQEALLTHSQLQEAAIKSVQRKSTPKFSPIHQWSHQTDGHPIWAQ